MVQMLRKIMAGNRRKYPRVRTELGVTVRTPTDSESLEVRTRNLSASGMEAVFPHPVQVLTQVDVLLDLDDGEESFHIQGQVTRSILVRSLWDRMRNQGERYSVGINFVDLEHPLRARIIRYLQGSTS